MLRAEDVALLACIDCRGPLAYRGWTRGGQLVRGVLHCATCCAAFDVEDGIARLYRERDVRFSDRVMRLVYDGMPSVHDPLVRFSFPFAVGETEAESRKRFLRRLEFETLQPRKDGPPLRVLEVGVGTGSNVHAIRERLPSGVAAQVWGVDLSLGMLGRCRDRMTFEDDREMRLLAADAHTLPFADGAFDRVFHTGAVNGYGDPARALAEMARVARPGTPIVVVDERLDPSERHSLVHRLFFKMMTIYDREPHAPVEALPPNATDVRDEQMGRFFYCLTWRTG